MVGNIHLVDLIEEAIRDALSRVDSVLFFGRNTMSKILTSPSEDSLRFTTLANETFIRGALFPVLTVFHLIIQGVVASSAP